MARTSPERVRDIIKVDDSINLQGFIDTASSLVSKLAAADTDRVHSAADLELIERWLAAHAYAHRDQLLSAKSEGRASGTFQGQTAMHFDSTQYGQMALMLDTTGFLAALQRDADGKYGFGLLWLGTEDNAASEAG